MPGRAYNEKFHLSRALQHGNTTISQSHPFAARAVFPVSFGDPKAGGSFAYRFSSSSPESTTLLPLSLFSRR